MHTSSDCIEDLFVLLKKFYEPLLKSLVLKRAGPLKEVIADINAAAIKSDRENSALIDYQRALGITQRSEAAENKIQETESNYYFIY